MQTLESIGQQKSLITRSLLYFHFGRRLFQRYIRLWIKNRRQRHALDVIESRHKKQIQMLESLSKTEIRRLNELIESYRNKIEIVQRESMDRMFETQKLIGISYATRDTDDRIQALRFKPFDEVRQAESGQTDLYYTLAPEHRDAYDAEYAAHVQLGQSQGYDKATIERTWKQFEEQIIAGIQE